MQRFVLFSDRESAAIAEYHNQVITLLQIITEMIEMGK
jgi:hypothetical protein